MALETIRTKSLILILTAICLGAVITPIMNSMVTVFLPVMYAEFNVSTAEMGLMKTSYMLAGIIFILPAIKIVEKLGYKKSFLLGAAAFAIFLFLSAFTPNYPYLLTMRILTGFFIVFVQITGLAILKCIFAPEQQGFAIGIYTAGMSIASFIGPLFGGVLTEFLDWRVNFLVTIPFLLLSCVLLFISLRGKEYYGKKTRSDWVGYVLFGCMTFCLMNGLAGFDEPFALHFIAAGILFLVGFIICERKVKAPALNLQLFSRNKQFTRASVALLLSYCSTTGITDIISLYLQYIGKLTPTETSIIFLLQPAIQVVGSPLVGKLADKMETKYLTVSGMGLIMLGVLFLSCAGWISIPPVIHVLIGFGLLDIGVVLFSAPNTKLVMGSVSREDAATASGLVAVLRKIGGLLSVAISMKVLSLGLSGAGDGAAESVFTSAMQAAMLVCATFAFIGMLFSWFKERKPSEIEGNGEALGGSSK